MAAVIVVLVIVFALGRQPAASSARTTTGQTAAQAVSADTSGGYGELVQRANGLYDQGTAAFQAQNNQQGANYYEAASKVYAAAWKKQSSDPNVGTDYATSLFYSGQIDAAIKQVTKVLAQSPDFQTGWFNKGNYLSERARQAEQSGEKSAATASYAQARAAYERAIAIDRSSQVGSQSQQRLSQLPQ